MAYEVIARKWRPQKFSDVVGQQHITQTLCNAITQNRVAHTYLFVGPRGIGKTTTARIFAKALNCPNQSNGEPCCQCDSCISITEGNNIDVIEIDAASNNGVDNIRNLRDEVMYMPTKSRFKVYIIDEVHMLSNNAWNALLKTIEEPPAHAKFLFATTEVHKVIPTVLSRCQRFDLRRIPTKLITERLRIIVDTENVKISSSALESIARAADGGMRDAQSLLDQMISFFGYGGQEISEQQILSLFGLTAENDMKVLLRAMLCNDKVTVIRKIHDLSLQGKNLEKLFDDILSWLRAVQLCYIVQDPALILETGDESIAVFKQLGQGIDLDVIQRLLEVLSPVGRILYDALNKQVFLETIILKAMRISHAARIDDLLKRLNQIRKSGELEIIEDPRLQQPVTLQAPPLNIQPPVTPAPAPAPAPAVALAPAPAVAPGKKTPSVAEPPISSPLSKSSEEDFRSVPAPEKLVKPPMQPPRPAPPPSSAPKAPIPSEPEPYLEPSGPALNLSEPMETAPVTPEKKFRESSVKPAGPAKDTLEDKAGSKPAQTVKTASEFDLKYSPQSLWHLLIAEMVKVHQPVLKDFMMEGLPSTLKGSVLTISYDDEYDKEHALEVKNNLELLNNCLHRITGNRNARIEVEMKRGISSPRESRINLNSEELKEVRKRMVENPFVQMTMDLFDGSIVDVHG